MAGSSNPHSPPSCGADVIALLWHPASPVSAERAAHISRQLKAQFPEYVELLSGPGLVLHAYSALPTIVSDRTGRRALLGEVYGASDLALASEGEWSRTLVDQCWGRYLAFEDGSTGAAPGFMRDPTGMLELFAVPMGDMLVVANPLPEALAQSLGIRLSIDWDAVASIAADPLNAPFTVPFEGMTIPVPGCWYSWDGWKLSERRYWSPASIAAGSSPPGAADRLYDTVIETVHRLASGHDNLALELSGGLDSSLLAGIMAQMHPAPSLYAVNISPRSPGGDERHYARAVASFASAQLTEVPVEPEALDYFAHRDRPRTILPPVYGFDILADTISSGHADAVGASRIFSGQGGDAVFFQPRTSSVLTDALRTSGFGRQWPLLAADMAFRRNVSVWSIMRDALWPRREDESTIRSAMGEIAGVRALAALEKSRRRHPWIVEAELLLPAKAMQVGMIANCQVFSHATMTGTGGRLVHPLLAQPVVEAALRVPIPELTPDRRDRGLARDLFARELAPEVRARRTKGEATGFYSRALAAHLESLRPFLLDSRLAANGVVDAQELQDLLYYDMLMTRDIAGLIGTLISLELWAERWS